METECKGGGRYRGVSAALFFLMQVLVSGAAFADFNNTNAVVGGVNDFPNGKQLDSILYGQTGLYYTASNGWQQDPGGVVSAPSDLVSSWIFSSSINSNEQGELTAIRWLLIELRRFGLVVAGILFGWLICERVYRFV